MNNIFKIGYLQIIACLIWGLIGVSIIAREFTVFSVVARIGKSISQFDQFFDTAHSHMNKGWEHFDDEMREFDEQFNKESIAFHRFVREGMLRRFKHLGYDVSDGTIKFKKESDIKPKNNVDKITNESHQTTHECSKYTVTDSNTEKVCLDEKSKSHNLITN